MSNVFKFFDRVQETAASISGTGTYTLAGATAAYRTFTSVLTDGDDKVPYLAISGTIWEINLGTFTASGTTLTRDTLLSSSTGSAISWSSATPTISLIEPAAHAGLGDIVSTLRLPEVSVSGATTATISRMHVISGTTYTLTLPATSGNAGKFIAGRITATGLVTLDGNASETIDGALTRVLWLGESFVLMTDGSNWFKLAGKSIPMMCKLKDDAKTQTMTNVTFQKQTFDATILDNTGMMADLTNERINIKRTSRYALTGVYQIGPVVGSVAPNLLYLELYLNGAGFGTTGVSGSSMPAAVGVYPVVRTSALGFSFTAGDYVELFGAPYTGSNETALNSYMAVVEVPEW